MRETESQSNYSNTPSNIVRKEEKEFGGERKIGVMKRKGEMERHARESCASVCIYGRNR